MDDLTRSRAVTRKRTRFSAEDGVKREIMEVISRPHFLPLSALLLLSRKEESAVFSGLMSGEKRGKGKNCFL